MILNTTSGAGSFSCVKVTQGMPVMSKASPEAASYGPGPPHSATFYRAHFEGKHTAYCALA
jgi:hypothetical protein